MYNWWDHSLAIGEVLFLGWGIRVCYNVRNAESLYNEARMISYAIYNIAVVNIMMIVFQYVSIWNFNFKTIFHRWNFYHQCFKATIYFNFLCSFEIHPHNNNNFSLIIFPQAGPDVKYFLGFIRTQLSTTTTVALVFAPKVLRVLRGQGDQLDHRARVRGITASFSTNGTGLVPEESPDLYQENEELKVSCKFALWIYCFVPRHFLIKFCSGIT